MLFVKSPLGEVWPFIGLTLLLFTKRYFIPTYDKIGTVPLDKTIFQGSQCIFPTLHLTLLGIGLIFHLKRVEFIF